MPNATTSFFVVGLLLVLPACAAGPEWWQAAQNAVPDVIVYLDSEAVAPAVLLRAEDTPKVDCHRGTDGDSGEVSRFPSTGQSVRLFLSADPGDVG
jgi:hypothetical protein